jgi:DNA-binding PadR family transcriptional regulator
MGSDEELPLTETAFVILLSVADKARHGYSIMKQVAALSAGRILLSTGTLYGALKRFIDKGWIVRVDEVAPVAGGARESGRVRKTYRLTRNGRQVLSAEAARLSSLARAAEAVLPKSRAAEATP